jgi:hypothetical protein
MVAGGNVSKYGEEIESHFLLTLASTPSSVTVPFDSLLMVAGGNVSEYGEKIESHSLLILDQHTFFCHCPLNTSLLIVAGGKLTDNGEEAESHFLLILD